MDRSETWSRRFSCNPIRFCTHRSDWVARAMLIDTRNPEKCRTEPYEDFWTRRSGELEARERDRVPLVATAVAEHDASTEALRGAMRRYASELLAGTYVPTLPTIDESFYDEALRGAMRRVHTERLAKQEAVMEELRGAHMHMCACTYTCTYVCTYACTYPCPCTCTYTYSARGRWGVVRGSVE